ncbi:MAG TPA: hypothetical protein VMM80_05610 [Bacteroidota bacterium]|nr:hypothetical protein [Bacteroidota bacterium]
MRIRVLASAVLIPVMVVGVTCGARAQGKLGVGVILGEPTGIAWKYRLGGGEAVDGAIGLSPADRFRFHVDYLWEKRSFEQADLRLHYGAGIAFGVGDAEYVSLQRGDTYVLRERNLGFGLRGVVGLTYNFPRSPFDAFVEIAPLFILTPAGGFGIDAAIGVRVYP